MQIASIESVGDLLKTEVTSKHEKLFDHIDGLMPEFETLLYDWKENSKQLLRQDDPFANHARKLVFWQRQFRAEESIDTHQLISDFQNFSKVVKIPFNLHFWQQQLTIRDNNYTEDQDKTISEQLLLKEWQKKLDEAQVEWQLKKLQQLRIVFFTKIEEWLNLLISLKESIDLLGLDAGVWLDLSHGELNATEIQQMKRWAQYLSEDKGARAICELLGKAKQISQSEKLETIRKTITLNTPYIDVTSKEEIVGLKMGREIEQALPSELALLSDPDTEILFDLKYIESRLLCFDMQGTAFHQEECEIEENHTEVEGDKLGPMILCVDTSGSMKGEPEYIAKAMALYLSTQAKVQQRACYLINFSTDIECYELTGNEGVSRLIQFLSQSFHGGTDVAPALRHALSVMEQETYNKADVLIISDFIMGKLPTNILDDINNQRESNNTFNSLVIGDCFMTERLKTHFDHEWVYNPSSSNIHELIQFKENVTQ